MDIVRHRKIFYALSLTLIVGSIVCVLVLGLKLGIDFKGGSLMELSFESQRPSSADVERALPGLGIAGLLVQPSGERNVLVRFGTVTEEIHQLMLQRLQKANLGSFHEEQFETIGPTIGQELKRKSLLALLLVLGAIILYIAWAFRKISRPLASWKYGVVAVLALMHDVTIPVGFFSVFSRFLGYEADTLFVTAVLTVLGFSVHDTIVVFDRIRENLRKNPGGVFADTVGKSIRETMGRSITTSLTVLLVLLSIYFFGGPSTKAFSFIMLIGVFFGTYSSIFIASPLLVTWEQWRLMRRT